MNVHRFKDSLLSQSVVCIANSLLPCNEPETMKSTLSDIVSFSESWYQIQNLEE